MLTKVKTLTTITVLCAVSFLCFRLAVEAHRITGDIHTTAISIQRTAASTQTTMADARRLLQIAGGTLNVARDTMRDEQKNVKAEADAVLLTTDNINNLVIQLSQTAAKADETLSSVPPLMSTANETIAKMGATMDGVNQVITGPVQSTMKHVDGATADVQTEIHRFVYPPPRPWWEKYIIDPAKIAGHVLTYSVK